VESGNIRQWLSLCHHVVTVNSTVGLEAALCGKPAILMGAAHYGGPKTASKGLTWDAGSPEELARAVEGVLGEPSPSAALAAKARTFLAQLHGRGHLLRTDHDGDLRVWVEYLLRLAPAIRSGMDPEACVRYLTEHPQGAAVRLGEARWRNNYRRLAGSFPVRQMLWLRRRLLGIPDPPREDPDG
jgi:hypothetical protein